jgi:hypothetical protein
MDPTDDKDPEDHADGILEAQLALVDARARLEYELSRLTQEHPDTAAGTPPLEEYSVTDLRSDDLNGALLRINAALGLTGEESDYWLKLGAYARQRLSLSDDDLQHMTRERLAELIEDELDGPKGIPTSERKALLQSYKDDLAARGGPPCSDRQIYMARNHPADEHGFKDWKAGRLPRTSQTAISIERFLRERTIPIRRTVPTT